MNDGGKGSTPRPFSVSQEEYEARWNLIFNKKYHQKTNEFDKVLKNEYYDILSTEDCLVDNEPEK